MSITNNHPLDPALPPDSSLQEAQQLFAGAGLPFPPVPAEMLARFNLISPWVYGTRSGTPSLYQLAWFVEEIETGPVEDYLLLGHAGYGANTWAIHYYLVWGPLALFLQITWGGIYTDKDESAQRLAGYFAWVEELLPAVLAAQEAGRLAWPDRLAVVISEFYGARWARFVASVPPTWQRGGPDLLQEVLASLRA